jgi:hypothetical protein
MSIVEVGTVVKNNEVGAGTFEKVSKSGTSEKCSPDCLERMRSAASLNS